jgi:hypothetical protein
MRASDYGWKARNHMPLGHVILEIIFQNASCLVCIGIVFKYKAETAYVFKNWLNFLAKNETTLTCTFTDIQPH